MRSAISGQWFEILQKKGFLWCCRRYEDKGPGNRGEATKLFIAPILPLSVSSVSWKGGVGLRVFILWFAFFQKGGNTFHDVIGPGRENLIAVFHSDGCL